MERTLMIIKPDAVSQNNIGEIIKKVEDQSFKVIALQMLSLTLAQAAEFYAVHREKPFYKNLLKFMTSGPSVQIVLERENAVDALRDLVGTTDPDEAVGGSIRRTFGTSIQKNAVHASDSPKTGAKEIFFFFGEYALQT